MYTWSPIRLEFCKDHSELERIMSSSDPLSHNLIYLVPTGRSERGLDYAVSRWERERETL